MTDKLREALELIKALDVPVNIVDVMDSTAREAVEIAKAALAQQDTQAATCKQCLQVDALLDEMLEAAPAVAQGESLGAKALRLADAIDPFTRKAPLDHLTSTVAAQTLRALAVAQVPPGYKLVPVKVTEEMEKTWWTNFGDVHALWAAMLNAAPTPPAQAVPVGAIERVRKALAGRKFRETTDLEDLLRMAANVIAEDGSVIGHMKAKISAPTPPAQQPLCWLDRKSVECLQGSEMTWMPAWNRPTSSDPVPVFLGPPAQRVMLTDEEISRIYTEQTGAAIEDSPWALNDFARAVIEAYERKNAQPKTLPAPL